MLKLEKITIEYAKLLFKNVNFILGNQEKVGLVGLNGTGKSTLLKIIAGQEIPMEGEVHLNNEILRYLPQEFDLTNKGEHEFLGEFMESLVSDIYSEIWKVEKTLSILDFGEIDEFQRIETLSPGMQMKLYLAKLLIDNPTILLLDEPTNHLDIYGIEWFEKFVKKFKGICIVISHDREFLNNITNKIFEIDEETLKVYEGNYDDFLIEKDRQIEERAMRFRLQERKRERLEASIKMTQKQAPGERQSRALQALRTRLEREITKNEITTYKAQKVSDIEMKGFVHNRKRILEINNLHFSYQNNKKIIDDLSLEIYGSEKIWIKGANGQGKSTLIKLITGELKKNFGEIRWGENLNWIYFSQTGDELNSNKTVQEYFYAETNLKWEDSYGVLNKFLFDSDLRNIRVKNLSPGQKSRLRFAIFTQQEFQCLILDEPTNHLDIETKEAIEKSIREFNGAVILVSHDRYFANRIEPDRVLELSGGRFVDSKKL